MQSNKNIKGRAIFSDEQNIRERSLKLYTYLVCHSYLRNAPNKFGDNVRIFQQRDIVLSQIYKTLGMEERTIKKYWESLEDAGLIRFCPRGWKEKFYDEKGNYRSLVKRWSDRNKHKDTYYEIPIAKGQLFRKIPKQTLTELNEVQNVKELTLKVYITLVNFQEDCIVNNYSYKKFTYQDLRDMLGYKLKADTDTRLELALNKLISLGLIDIEKGTFTNTYGVDIPVFVLNEVGFYIKYDIKNYKTGLENVVEQEQIERVKGENQADYPDVFSED